MQKYLSAIMNSHTKIIKRNEKKTLRYINFIFVYNLIVNIY
jgi:hypothetical protein